MLPSDAHSVLSVATPQVIVATFTTLNPLRRDFPLQYVSLAAALDLVIVDECHYEPAPEWGQSVKRLKKPTLLLTATPYRNNLKPIPHWQSEEIGSSLHPQGRGGTQDHSAATL
jgi:superfamily II DNA or RNA helicase